MAEMKPLKCRGCLAQLVSNDLYSFVWKEIRELFEECTNIKVT